MDETVPGVPQEAVDSLVAKSGNFASRKAMAVANEIAKRRIEALRLYRPQPMQEEFHKCTATERMIQGGNRAGKSLGAFVEDARAVLNCDPYNKYPEKDGVLAVVGYKEWHIGNVIYPYLFKAGAFKIIRDEETDQWRVYRPWVPQDKARAKEAKPAPPLIPPRMVKRIVWKDRGKNVFSNVYLKTGWEIKAFSSKAKPDQGYQADIIHIDEDILDPRWYNEAAGRLVDRKGKLIWSALPHDDNDAIARFAERAEKMEEDYEKGVGDKPTTVVFRASMEENPYLPEDAKKAAIAGWKSMGDDVYRKRALGELVTDSVLMYPMWKQSVHDIVTYEGQLNGEPDQYLAKREIPPHWTRRLCVDPGHDTGAAVLIATPPSAKFHLVYDEIYIHQCTAPIIAEALAIRTRTDWFQSFLIDAHGGNLTSLDTGVSPREAYEREMKTRRVECVETGHRFTPGCAVITYREEILRNMLLIQKTGSPSILVDFEKCPNLDREMRRFRKKKVNGLIVDTGNRRGATHAAECLEYLAVYLDEATTKYIAPPERRLNESAGERRVRLYKQRMKERQEAMNPFGVTSTIILGPAGSFNG